MDRALLLIMLCAAGSAHAATWTVAADVGQASLDSRHHDDADVDTDMTLGLRGAWWLHPQIALEAGWLRADTGYRTNAERFERDYDVWTIGARYVVPFGDRFFALAKGGYARNRIDTEEPRVVGTDVELVHDDSDAGHYLGIGVGWRWDERWSSTLELTRVYGDVAYGCKDGFCATTHSSYLDGASFGIAYDFE